jgi:hypothetical protein
MYAAADDLAAFLRIHDDTEHPYLAGLLSSSTAAVDAFCGQSFQPAAGSATARTYAARFCDLVSVAPISSTTDLVVETDTSGNGTFDVTWVATDYQLEPLDRNVAGLTDHPYTAIRAIAARYFPVDRQARVRVTARWGWATIPDSIRDATLMHAARLHERRNAPAGIVAGDGFIGRTSLGMDPDVKALLMPYKRPELWI